MRNKLSVILSLIIVLAFIIVPSCQCRTGLAEETEYRLELIKEIKAFENKLSFTETENFQTYSDEIEAYPYYFYTSSTELPYSLGDPRLQFGTGTPESVAVDEEKYDVYFYSIEALAGIKTPVTKSLIQAPFSRFLHVVFHEDWHEQIDLPLGIEEPSAEVVGYAAAIAFAREKLEQNPKIYDTLEEQLNNRLRESKVYEYYYEQLNALYSNFNTGKISEADTLRRKEQLIRSMGNELQSIWGGKPDQLNNAFIAFQMTYLRHLTPMYEVLSATDFDLVKTIAIFRAMPEQGTSFDNLEKIKNTETQVIDYLQNWQSKQKH